MTADVESLEQARRLLADGRLDMAEKLLLDLPLQERTRGEAAMLESDIADARGDLARAEKLLTAALSASGKDAQAAMHHRLGQVLFDQGKVDRAITSYRRALRIETGGALVHRDLGVAYLEKGWTEEAIACFKKATHLDPADHLAREFLGRAHRDRGELRQALAHFARALVLRLSRPFLRGRDAAVRRATSVSEAGRATASSGAQRVRAALAEGRFDDALEAAVELKEAGPEDPEALFVLGLARARVGDVAEAIDLVQQAIYRRPDSAAYYAEIAELWLKLDAPREAISALEGAARLGLDNAHARGSRALAYYRLRSLPEAEQWARSALALERENNLARGVLGMTLVAREAFAEAEQVCREALATDPELPNALLALAVALKESGRLEEASDLLGRAMGDLATNPVALVIKGGFDLDLADVEAAERHARQALLVDAGYADAHVLLANVLLLQERWTEGWREYEWRKRYRHQVGTHAYFRRKLREAAPWTGAPLDGKRIVLTSEQGLGEQILFGAFVPDIVSQARGCGVVCEQRLQPLFARSFPGAEVIGIAKDPDGKERFPGDFDFVCAMASIPAVLAMSAGNVVPPRRGYLKADPQRVAAWREKLGVLGAGPKVGIAWRGGTNYTGRSKRSAALDDLGAVLGLAGSVWVSLQYGECEAEIAAWQRTSGVRIHHWPEAIADFDEYAALMSALDHRVVVCSTAAHFAGALDLPSSLLSPPTALWLYGLRETVPWYPALRVYRQARYQDWAGPVTRLAHDLTQWMGQWQSRN